MRGKPLRIEWQHTESELLHLYKTERRADMRARIQALWLLRSGRRITEVAPFIGVTYNTVQRWTRWYRQGGLELMREHRRGNRKGRKPFLELEQREQLRQELRKGEFRTVYDAIDWVKKTFGVTYTYAGMYDLVVSLGAKKKSPRPLSSQGSVEAQEEWKKGD